MDLHRARPHGRLIALLVVGCATADARPARPPPLAQAQKVATAWLRAAARRTIPKSSGPAIAIDAKTDRCTGNWDRSGLRAAVRCLAKALAHADLTAPWTSPRIRGDTRDVDAKLTVRGGPFLVIEMTIAAAGQVTALHVSETLSDVDF